MTGRQRRFQLRQHDILDYELAWAEQQAWVGAILSYEGLSQGSSPQHQVGQHQLGKHGQDNLLAHANLLLLLEHPSVYTMGRSSCWRDLPYHSHCVANPAERLAHPSHELSSLFSSIPIIKSDRGGKVTYHGPGQLVAYVVCDLRPHALLSVCSHVAQLEETAIETLSIFGISAQRDPGNPGLWVDNAKIAAVGVRIRRGVAYHGIAINRNPDLRMFQGIIPCGLAERAVTSVAALGVEISRRALETQFLLAFRHVFNVHWEES